MANAPTKLSYMPPVVVREVWDNLMYTYIDEDIVVILLSPNEDYGATIVKSECKDYTVGEYIQYDEIEAQNDVIFTFYSGSVTIGEDPVSEEPERGESKFGDVQELVEKSRVKL